MKKIILLLAVIYSCAMADNAPKWNLTIAYDYKYVTTYEGFSSLEKCQEFAVRKKQKIFNAGMLFLYHCDVID